MEFDKGCEKTESETRFVNPHRFECQKSTSASVPPERNSAKKRKHAQLIEDPMSAYSGPSSEVMDVGSSTVEAEENTAPVGTLYHNQEIQVNIEKRKKGFRRMATNTQASVACSTVMVTSKIQALARCH